MAHILKIKSIEQVTHDVRCFRLEKPSGYSYTPGQATDVSVHKPGWEREQRPFTFTSLNSDPYLEFTIKRYDDHDGVTRQIHQLQPGDELILGEPWGAIAYKNKGYFIAGGAGITPFIAILRQLRQDQQLAGNKLFFSNKTTADIIYKEELEAMLGDDAVFIVTEEKTGDYLHKRIDEHFLEQYIPDFRQTFYICGPDAMIKSISSIVVQKGADPQTVVFEK